MRFDEVKTQEQFDEFMKFKSERFYRVVLYTEKNNDKDEEFDSETWWSIEMLVAESIPPFGKKYRIDNRNEYKALEIYLFNNLREAWHFYCDKSIKELDNKIALLEKERKDLEESKKLKDLKEIDRQIPWLDEDDYWE